VTWYPAPASGEPPFGLDLRGVPLAVVDDGHGTLHLWRDGDEPLGLLEASKAYRRLAERLTRLRNFVPQHEDSSPFDVDLRGVPYAVLQEDIGALHLWRDTDAPFTPDEADELVADFEKRVTTRADDLSAEFARRVGTPQTNQPPGRA
jgi:hypothetical protein